MRYTRALRLAPLAVPVLLVLSTGVGQSEAQVDQHTVSVGGSSRAQAPLTRAQARALSRHVTDKVIIVLRDQLPRIADTPANSARRTSEVRSLQHGILAELAQTHAKKVHSISLVNAIAATVSRGEAKRLSRNPAVSEVVPDLPIPLVNPTVPKKAAKGVTPLPGACLPDGKVQLNPEAIETIHAASQSKSDTTAQGLGYTGAGVKVAFIADGLDTDNPDFIRPDGKHVFVDYQDFSGTGTDAPTDGAEAFLDASSIAAQGRETYNVASYGVGLDRKCNIRILGVAPGASLVGLNVFGSSNFAYNSVFLEAINYAVTKDHVNVINESFGDNPFPDTANLDLTRLADEDAVKAGVTVTVSAGDAGVTNTIGSPATDPAVISAGASTTYRAYAQTGIGGITTPGIRGWVDNNISGLSSAGFDQSGGTVDVVAPGDLNWALCTPKPALYAACTNFSGKPAAVELEGGTSEAAPLTAGTAALVIQAYREAHHGATPKPALVKQFIVSTAQDINAPADQQGAGLIDPYQAVLAAKDYKVSTRTGSPILDSTTQFNAAGATSSPQSFTESLTNEGSKAVTLGLASRTLAPYTTVAGSPTSLTLSKATGYEDEVQLTVPSGQARLNVSLSTVGAVNLSLVSPSGDLASYNLPQGVGNYGNAEVADPAPGTWTALLEVTPTTPTLPATLKVAFSAQTATWQPFGSLTANSLSLAAGATKSVTLNVSTPSEPGDESGAIVVTNTAASPTFTKVTTIPVTLRSYAPAPTPTSATTFTGTLTGGNGRQPSTGQTAYYQVDVPDGQQVLNADVTTGNKGNTMFAELVDPSGEAASTATSGMLATSPSGNAEIQPEDGTQLHVLNPAAGVWTLIVDFYNTVSGTATSQPFNVTLTDTAVPASASNLPDSTSDDVDAGTPIDVPVTVTNNGTTPEEYFIDARTTGTVTEKLAPQTTSSVVLPNLAGVVPIYLVPSHTSELSTTATAKDPLFYDYTYAFGDPDLPSTTGTTATGSYSASDIPSGDWTITPFLKGPTGAKAHKFVTARVSMSATTLGFNAAFSSPTGDLWQDGTSATNGVNPVVADPGQTVTIDVVLTPEGSASQQFTGTLYVDSLSAASPDVTFDDLFNNVLEGSDVAAFPYAYTINP